MLATICCLIFAGALLLAVVTDLASMTIPNRLVGAVALSFFVYALSADWPWALVGWHLATGCAILCLTFAAFACGWMGGGDAKLIAASALWFGPTSAFWDYLFLASLFGGVLTLAILMLRACLRPTTGNASIDRLLDAGSGVPYGVALGPAGLIVLARFPEMQSLLALM